MQNILYALRTNPSVYVPEIIGGRDSDLVCLGAGASKEGTCFCQEQSNLMILKMGRFHDARDSTRQCPLDLN